MKPPAVNGKTHLVAASPGMTEVLVSLIKGTNKGPNFVTTCFIKLKLLHIDNEQIEINQSVLHGTRMCNNSKILNESGKILVLKICKILKN